MLAATFFFVADGLPYMKRAFMPVTSLSNPRIKYLSRLARRQFREKENRFIIEGSLMVREALLCRWPLEQLAFTPAWGESRTGVAILKLASSAGVQLLEVGEAVFSKLSSAETPQGVMAVGIFQKTALSQLFEQNSSLLLAVDGLQDPGNLGAIIRSADAAGAGGVVLLKGTVDPYNPKTLRATMGSIFHLPVVEVPDKGELFGYASKAGLQLVASAPQSGVVLFLCNLTLPSIFVIGNESVGCSNEILKRADQTVSIPMPGRAESLNAAAAASIMLYEAIRQRSCQR